MAIKLILQAELAPESIEIIDNNGKKQVKVNVSEQKGNQIEEKEDGLFVNEQAGGATNPSTPSGSLNFGEFKYRYLPNIGTVLAYRKLGETFVNVDVGEVGGTDFSEKRAFNDGYYHPIKWSNSAVNENVYLFNAALPVDGQHAQELRVDPELYDSPIEIELKPKVIREGVISADGTRWDVQPQLDLSELNTALAEIFPLRDVRVHMVVGGRMLATIHKGGAITEWQEDGIYGAPAGAVTVVDNIATFNDLSLSRAFGATSEQINFILDFQALPNGTENWMEKTYRLDAPHINGGYQRYYDFKTNKLYVLEPHKETTLEEQPHIA